MAKEGRKWASKAFRKKRKQERSKWAKASYNEYILSAAWKSKRVQAFKYYGKKCQQCGAKNVPLQVHHRTYDRLGNEKMYDLEVLCVKCHHDRHPEKFSGTD